jgi:Ricin-type beta-trefoil lectin domain-like
MKAQHSGKCLQMVDGNKQRGAISWVEECIGNDAQKFKLVSDKAGSYSITTKDSGLCLGVYYATKDDNAPVLQWDCSEVDQLKWQLVM